MNQNNKKPVKKLTITDANEQLDVASTEVVPEKTPPKVSKITVIHDDEPQPTEVHATEPVTDPVMTEDQPATAPLVPKPKLVEPKKAITITVADDEAEEQAVLPAEDATEAIESINAALEKELAAGVAEPEPVTGVADDDAVSIDEQEEAVLEPESNTVAADEIQLPTSAEADIPQAEGTHSEVEEPAEEELSGGTAPVVAAESTTQSQLVKAALNNNLRSVPNPVPPVSDTSEVGNPQLRSADVPALQTEPPKPAAFTPPTSETRKKRSLKAFFGALQHSKTARWATFGALFVVLLVAGALPATRYYALNVAGVRSSASVQVIDESTLQPLKNVEVKIADQIAQTDDDGRAQLKNLKLGSAQLVIQKRAFAPINKPITVGWGSNPLGGFNLTPVGSQYGFSVVDYLSGKPVAKVQASVGDANAQSNEKGVIKLTLDHENSLQTIDVKVTAEGYRDETLKLDLNSKQVTSLKLVPAGKEVFLSKRTGTYDVYAVDVDGKNEKLLLGGTGRERDSLMLVPSSDGKAAALISTRDEARNADGFLKSTLTMIDVNDGAHKSVIQSEQISVVGWTNNRLVYIQVAAGTSAGNPSRVKLMSYDYKTGDNHQLASTNYFNDVLLVNGKIYYAPSSTYQGAGVAVNLFSINPDGSNKQTVLGEETWNAFRTGYDSVVLSVVDQKWYSYALTGAPTKLEGAPGNIKSRVYVDSPDGKRSLWVDERDGKGVLLSYDIAAKTDKVLQSKSGLTLPLRWLSGNSVVYRISNGQETADYALSLDGGEPHKITDVTNTNNVDGWYYY